MDVSNIQCNIFKLYDYGINAALIKELADNRISPYNIFLNEMRTLDVMNTSENKKINIYKQCVKMIQQKDCSRTIYEFLYQGISKGVCDNLFSQNASIEEIRNLNYDILKQEYNIGKVMADKLKNAILSNDIVISESNDNIDTYQILENILKEVTINGPISYFDFRYKTKNSGNYIFNNFEKDYSMLQSNKKVKNTMYGIEYTFDSVASHIKKVLDEKDYTIYISRLKGKTLRMIGNEYGLTRERIRQIESRILKNINSWYLSQDKIYIEDRLKDVFEKYDWNQDIFCKIFDLDMVSFQYLNTKYKKGTELLQNILKDEYFNDEQKQIFMESQSITITEDGLLINDSDEFLKRFCLKNCKDEISIQNITEKYNDEIKLYPELKLEETTERNFEGKLSRTNYIVFGSNHMLRYFDFEELSDDAYNDLNKLIELSDGFYSTEYLFRNNLKLMKELDIRNEYELHNILKWRIDDDENNVYFIRMPNFLVEYKDKDEFILDKIKEYSPVSLNDFIDILYEDYGHKKPTMLSYLTSNFSKYITNGEFNYNTVKITSEELEKLAIIFTNDIYSIESVELVLSSNGFKDKDIINNYNFMKFGYKLKSGFIIKSKFRGVFDYMDSIIKEDTILKLESDLIHCGAVYNALYYHCSELNLFKITDNAYLTITKLESLGITKGYIEEFIKKIKTSFIDKDYFSVYNVIDELDVSKFTELGLTESFIDNILFYIDELKTLRINNYKLYTFNSGEISRSNFMYDMINKYRSISLNELEQEIKNNYQIEISVDKLKEYISYNTDIFYSNILDKIYSDKSDYYEEVYDE